jgi:MFS family permease
MSQSRSSVIAISFVLALGFVVNYVDRGNLSVAAPLIQREFHIDPIRLGLLFSAFVFSYAIMQVPAGYLADRLNLKWLYAGAFLWWSLANSAIFLATGFLSLLFLRTLLSVGEAISLPASSKVLATLFSEDERGIANGILDSGYKFGPALGVAVGGALLGHFGWRYIFLFTGLGSLLWLIPWFWVANSISSMHVSYKDASAPVSPTHAVLSVKDILLSTRAWGTFFGNFCGGYVWYLMLSWLPSYLVNERHLNLASMGLVGSLLFGVTGVTSILSGIITDRMIRAGVSPSRARLGFMIAGLLFSALLVPAGFAHSSSQALGYMFVAFAAYGMYSSNVWAATQSIAGAPNIGRWAGIQNLIGNLGGVASPAITGWIVSVSGSFRWAFALAAVFMVVGILIYVFIVRTLDPIRTAVPQIQLPQEAS